MNDDDQKKILFVSEPKLLRKDNRAAVPKPEANLSCASRCKKSKSLTLSLTLSLCRQIAHSPSPPRGDDCDATRSRIRNCDPLDSRIANPGT